MKDAKETMLMAIRCGYLTGSFKLTKKGKGFLSPSMWRVYFNLKCFFIPRQKIEMLNLLEDINKCNKVNKLYPDN